MTAVDELESALKELDDALEQQQIEQATAALPKVLAACAGLRGANVHGAASFAHLRHLADQAMARARALQIQIGWRLTAAGNSRKAARRYGRGG